MTRDIKFRAWDEKNKDMSVDLIPSENYADAFEGILMQYTGLKDKNGKEIYEGDIVRGRTTDDYEFEYEKRNQKAYSVSEVKWDDEMTGWIPFKYFSTNGVNSLEDKFYETTECEVIGNIYENPELLDNSK